MLLAGEAVLLSSGIRQIMIDRGNAQTWGPAVLGAVRAHGLRRQPDELKGYWEQYWDKQDLERKLLVWQLLGIKNSPWDKGGGGLGLGEDPVARVTGALLLLVGFSSLDED